MNLFESGMNVEEISKVAKISIDEVKTIVEDRSDK